MACILKRRASTTQSEIHFSNGLEYSQTDKKQCWRGQDLRSTFVPLAGQSSILVYNTCVVVMTIHGSITTTGRGAIFRFNKSPCFCLFDCSLCSEVSTQFFIGIGLFETMNLELILVTFPSPSSLSCFDSFFLSHKACIIFCVSFLCEIPYHVPSLWFLLKNRSGGSWFEQVSRIDFAISPFIIL